MELRGPNGTVFHLNLAGYQFPEILDDEAGSEWDPEYDSNWLLIDIYAARAGRVWRVQAPSLLTWEVEELARWLEGIASDEKEDPLLVFLEPSLTFELLNRGERQVRLHVHFQIPRHQGQTVEIGLLCPTEALVAAADNLRAQLTRFPQRILRRDSTT